MPLNTETEPNLYSPDLDPSDYHLLRELLNHLDGPRLTSKEKVEHISHLYLVISVRLLTAKTQSVAASESIKTGIFS